ncbi:MAG TPA: hypothetical protein VN610_08340, partial [Bryobacteraceae bacterium]|nr:hypothetical protein [Bryobacteraceae bacterium]
KILKKRDREREKRLRGWRGIVFNRAFAVLVFALIAWFVQNPWVIVCLLAPPISGIVAAVIIHFSH